MTLPNLDSMDDQELAELVEAAQIELRRRRVVAEAPQLAESEQHRTEERLDQIAAGFITARDGAPGQSDPAPWVQPTGPHCWYPRNWSVTHGGKVWVSVIPNNAHEPGGGDHGQAWVEDVPTPAPGGHVPWGAGQVVAVDDLRTHNGTLWRAKVHHTTHVGWEPSVHTHGVWEDMGPASA